MRSISSGVMSPADAPSVVADVQAGLVKFGSGANPAFVPMISGVSSIHSAVAWVELYGTVVVNVSPRVTSLSVMFHTFELGTVSAIAACMWSPGATVMLTVSDGAGTSSYQ